jgi:hypothetical protein
MDKKTLEKQYTTLSKTSRQISKEFGISKTTVLNLLRKYNIPRRSSLVDLSKQKFGDLTAIKYIADSYWLCKCDCGTEKKVMSRHLKEGLVVSCGCRRRRTGNKSLTWKGFGDVPAGLLAAYKHGAKRRDLEFNVTAEYLWNVFLTQDGRCVFTGLPISIGRHKDTSASIDRIDSTKGYVEGNVQWVHKIINLMKWDRKAQDFIQWCHLVANHCPM